jgi:hypothetical protein
MSVQEMSVQELREATVRYLLYEQTRRDVGMQPTLPSFDGDQLYGLVTDLLKAKDIESK